MQIELSNINKIKHASIEVGGLTVITGINDSGKSTVGKALFCAIKALSSSEGDSFEYKTRIVRECIDRIYRYTRIGYSIATREKEKGREEFIPPRFMNSIQPFIKIWIILLSGLNLINSYNRNIQSYNNSEFQT